MMRFFALHDIVVYEQTRATLNDAWGLPNSSGTVTCLSPAAEYMHGTVLLSAAPRDANGRIVAALRNDWCEWPPADALLGQLLSAGLVTEITEAEYLACLPSI
jgi:hypothetical protein